MAEKARVVIVGGGFGGFEATRALKGSGAEITLIDRRNHLLFQPLLYQVATAALTPSDIAWPIRQLVRDRADVTTLLAEVVGVDTQNRHVELAEGDPIPYDFLVLSTGARHAYFGHNEWEAVAPGLKTLEDATLIRRNLLLAFEEAERTTDPARRAALLTFVIIGGGPTGVELAGTIVELARVALRDEFRNIDPTEARVILVEGLDRVLSNFDSDLSDYSKKALERLGVEVRLGRNVTEITAEGVKLGDEFIASPTVLWGAGVQASPVAQWLGAEADKAGRVKVSPDLSVPGHPEIFVIGDAAAVLRPDGKPVPGIGDAAKQAGRHVARLIRRRMNGEPEADARFGYNHAGDLATIGRRAAVIDFGWIKLTGWLAWWVWGVAHIYFLIGNRNRFLVAFSWLWTLLFGRRGARLITFGSVDINQGSKKPGG